MKSFRINIFRLNAVFWCMFCKVWFILDHLFKILILFRLQGPIKTAVVFMNLRRVHFSWRRWFASSPSTISSSVSWISPLKLSKLNAHQPDPPPDTRTEARRKSKYISHNAAINLIKRERDPQHALEIFNMVSEQKGFNHNNATYATILNKLAQSKKFKAVDAVLYQMKYDTCKFHEGIFLNLMKHFSKFSMHERVLEMFHAIQPIVREKPSLKCISTCLNLLIEANQVHMAQQFLMHLKKSLNFKLNTCIANILVKHYCKNGDLESAFEVVKNMKKSKLSYPNLITYSTLIDGLCQSGKLTEAMDMFEEMISKEQILPDVLTYNILMQGFCCAGKVDRARKILDFMKSKGCNPNIYNYSTLMNGFCKEVRLKEAQELLDEMKSFGIKPDTVVYTTLIDCHCRTGRVDEAIELLKEMKERRCKADTVTFNVILGGLCREGRIEDALKMLDELPYEGIYLNKGSYRIVLNSLCQKGDLNKAKELLRLMMGRGFVPHYATSNELLVSLCEAGMTDDATTALFGLVEMGFKPLLDSWTFFVKSICRERKLLPAFELLDELVNEEFG